MKILIVGNYNFFSVALVSRLKREKHNTFIICGKKQENGYTYKQKADVEYWFDPSDSSVHHIIDDVRPEAIIFMGAYDTSYRWHQLRTAGSDYLSSLTSILSAAVECNTERLIYLSDIPASEVKRQMGQKDIAVSSGEHLCGNYAAGDTLSCVIARFSSVYGVPEQKNEDCGELTRFIYNGLLGLFKPDEERSINAMYVSDAVEAVYRLLSVAAPGEMYNIRSGRIIRLSELYAYLQEIENLDAVQRTAIPDKVFEQVTEPSEFDNEFGFKCFVSPITGIRNVAVGLFENKLLDIAPQFEGKKTLWQRFMSGYGMLKRAVSVVLPYIENILMFAFAQLLIYYGYPDVAQILVFYIVFMSAFFSRAQMFISIVLSVVSFTFFHNSGSTLYMIVSDYSYIFTVLTMILSGFIVSALRDKLHSVRVEKDFVISTQEKEIAELNSMLDTSRDIKAELESRLLNHSDSLSKIYGIVSQLDAMETRKVFMGALRVVSEIMRSKDVSIYMSGNNSSYFRCVASSTPKARESMPTSIKITDYAEVYDALKNDNIYVNTELNFNLPVMALAISTGEEFNVVIMLWSIDFKDLGLYHINLFLVIRMIMTNSINRAYQYELATIEQRYYPNTSILRKEFFSEILDDQKKISADTNSPFALLRIATEPGSQDSLIETGLKLSGSLRTTDYLGVSDDDALMLILGGTGENDVPFVISRLTSKGVEVEVMSTNEQ